MLPPKSEKTRDGIDFQEIFEDERGQQRAPGTFPFEPFLAGETVKPVFDVTALR